MFSYSQIKSLNDLEISVYNYIMDNKDKVRYMKIRELAVESHVSTTTILNFCKKMGCSGYSEFKLKFKLFIEEKEIKKVSEDNTEIIDFFKKTNTEEYDEKIDEIVKAILKAKRTIFIGSSMSGIVARYGARYLSSVGQFSLCIDDPYYPTTGKFYENSVVIVCSVSGESKDIIGHINRFKKDNCCIVSITNTENCTIAKMSDYNIPYYVPYVKVGIYDITTQIPIISIIERIGRKLQNRQEECIKTE